MIDSADHVSPKTGLSPTVTLSKNGGSFAAPAGAVSEVGNGVYKVAGNATDSNTLGPLWLHATASGADPTDTIFPIVAYDPQDAVRLGQSALPNAAANANGGLPVLSSAGTTLAYTISTLTTYTGNTPQTGDAYARLGAPAGLSVSSDVAAVKSDLDAGVKVSSYSTGQDPATLIGSNLTIDGKTFQQAIEYMAASIAGKVSGAGSGTEVFKGLDGATTRLTITCDSVGNRTAITYG